MYTFDERSHKQRQQVVEAGVKTHAVPARSEQEGAQAGSVWASLVVRPPGASGGPLALVVLWTALMWHKTRSLIPSKGRRSGAIAVPRTVVFGDSPSNPEDMTHPTSQSPSKQDGVRHTAFLCSSTQRQRM